MGGTPPSSSVRIASFAPGRVLDEHEEHAPIGDRETLEAAEGRAEASDPRGDVVERDPERQRERCSGKRVVDVVEPGHRETDACAAGRRVQHEGDTVEAVRLDLAGGDVERRPGVAAHFAAVRAEVRDVGGVVPVRVTAADAVLRVGRVLQRGASTPRVVDPEQDDAVAALRERGDERVVGVRHQRRLGRKLRDRVAPSLGDVLELAVPVELVPEQVSEADGTRARAAHHLRKGELVDLEQSELRTVRREERRRDARGEVGARVVPREPVRRPEDRARDGGRRGLAIRGGDEHDALREPAREELESSGIELPDELPGQRRPAPATGRARKPADEPGRGRFERKPCTHGREGSGNDPLCPDCRMSKML